MNRNAGTKPIEDTRNVATGNAAPFACWAGLDYNEPLLRGDCHYELDR